MNATPLRHRLKIYRPTNTRSLTGAVKVGQWEHALTLWGQFTPLSVKDIIAGRAQNSQITARAKIRYRDDIDGTMRVQYGGRMYEIVGEPLVDNGSGKEYLTLALKGVSNDR
ncbi:phage head closure protein [Moraxella bovis]|uniref:phage head closure protein n=1 Tax=Moraxella bovis TaxID=476 RepID=UPI002226F81A|nr:phage head closure protein [Moraxella bovis]UYZ74096.1 phage head closure protein [Moraxella bovis]UYZ80099.1 phage head closure protein [Moraxella bovis]UZA13262.1 phage head closure protein [Moraxella bovis]